MKAKNTFDYMHQPCHRVLSTKSMLTRPTPRLATSLTARISRVVPASHIIEDWMGEGVMHSLFNKTKLMLIRDSVTDILP